MNKQLLITVGIVIILIVALVWVYLLIFGTPSSPEEVFTDLGLSEQPNRTPPPVAPPPSSNELAITKGLQQLTTRPIAGLVGLVSSTTRAVRYVEQGTGHVYEINLLTKTETRLTQTTFPRIQRATFSPDGTYVILTSANGLSTDSVGGKVDENTGTISATVLPTGADNITVFNNGTAAYSVSGKSGSLLLTSTLSATGTPTTLASLPLSSVQLRWGNTATDTVYIATKPAQALKGFLFAYRNGELRPTPLTGFGLTVERGGDNFLVGDFSDEGYRGLWYNAASNTQSTVSILVLPEKCALGARTICAAPFEFSPDRLRAAYPDPWYRGDVTSPDVLWEIAPSTISGVTSATVLSNLQEEAGRTVDVTDVTVAGELIFFRNRIDNTLWLYE